MVGHCHGWRHLDVLRQMYPDQIKKVVTLDNLRVPFMTEGKFKILSSVRRIRVQGRSRWSFPMRSCEKVRHYGCADGYQHTDMSDRGPDTVKTTIQAMLDKFLEDDSPLKPVETNTPKITDEPGPVALYVADQELTAASRPIQRSYQCPA